MHVSLSRAISGLLLVSASISLVACCAGFARSTLGLETQPVLLAGTRAVRYSEAAAKSKTFTYTGAQQSFKVPAGVTQLVVTATGASGGGYASSGPAPGLGGVV